MPALLASHGNVSVDILELALPNVKETRDLLSWCNITQESIKPLGIPKLDTVAALAATPHKGTRFMIPM
jgi:hypothetical protein